MTITIKLKTDNAAFEQGDSQEVIRILRTVIDRISDGGVPYAKGNLLDLNGNTVGTVKVTGR
jgi:hypothetical protein